MGYDIFTQGEDWDDLKAMVKDAVLCHFGDDGEARVVVLDKAAGSPRPDASRAYPNASLH